jgi:outer membrane protein OmpA-like peptidoglycan-associated protein
VSSSFSLKTNLLYDAVTAINLGAEFRLGHRSSLEIAGSWSPFSFSDNRKWKHVLLQPELRFWPTETFHGHFFGLHGLYASYNVGALPRPPFSRAMSENRYQGWLAGAGLSYGYRWNFSSRWGLEASAGFGFVHLDYGKFDCVVCGEEFPKETRNYFAPTKAALTLVYRFGEKERVVRSKVRPEAVSSTDRRSTKREKQIVRREPLFEASFVNPPVERVKQRSETGSAFLEFASGQTEILRHFQNNAAELNKIQTLIETVRNDPSATITGISIKGYASPEGTYHTNLTLSEKRAVALKNYIRSTYGFSESLFTVSGLGEDWAGLDSLVSLSNLRDKQQILTIIRETNVFRGRERLLMDLSGGNPYRYMLQSLFPLLRRSEYRIDYTVRAFTVEQGKEIFYSKPSSLSLNELFQIANTCELGSPAFNEVFETAAQLHPGSDVANLNASACALERKDTAAAKRYLDRVAEKSPAYWNNAGILAYQEGDSDRAEYCFARAAGAGNNEASANAEKLADYLH